jgi:signal transduction histidine kinase
VHKTVQAAWVNNPFANDTLNTSYNVDVNRDGKIEPDGPDKLQWPGQQYPEAADIPETFAAYNGPITSANLYTDEYGSVLTGYAPIRDGNGEVVAILATDIKADDFFTITTQTLRPFLSFILFLTLIITFLTMIIIYVRRRYTKFLEKSNDEKSEFISFASHQLRTPLTSIKGFASMLLEGDHGDINPEVRDALQKIMVRTNDMVSLIGQYLNKSRMELGQLKYDMNEFDMVDILTQVAKGFKPNADQAKLGLTLSIAAAQSYRIRADQGKIKEVIGNLIDNSIKYTPQGAIRVALSRIEQTIRIAISDTGVGMNEATLHDLFKKFSRAKDASKTNILGNGLGLYLAKTIVDAHHGKIWAESAGKGKGSTFFVELPMR